MKSTMKAFCLVVATLLFAACSTAPSLHEQLMTGQWEGEMQGFPLTLKYTETEMHVVGMGMSLPYQLDGDTMTFEIPGQGSMEMKVAVEGDTLIQTDVKTGQSNTMERKM